MTHSSSPVGPARDHFTDAVTIIVRSIGSVLTLGASLFAAGAWMIRRIDERLGTVDHRLSPRIGSVEGRLGARIDTVEEKLGARIDAVAADVTDLKIAVARLEGPPRRLLVSGS